MRKKITYISVMLLILTKILFTTIVKKQEDLDLAINNLAFEISQHMAEKQKTKIAVIPFQDLRTDMITTLGKYIAEELTTSLFNTGKFQIIERNLLNNVLEELKLSQTGAVDPSSAKELGKITGVDALVTGTIQDLKTLVAVNCRLIEIETGEVFAVANAKIRRSKNIIELLEETKEKVEKELRTDEESLKLDKEFESLFKISEEYIKLKDYVSALAPLEKCIELNPESGPAYYNLGIVYYCLKDKFSAFEVVNELKKIDPNLAEKLRKIISR